MDPLGLFGEREAIIGLSGEECNFFFELVDPFAKAGSVFGGAIAKVEHELGDGPFFTEIFDFKLFDVFGMLDGAKVGLELFAKCRYLLFHDFLQEI